MSADQELTTPRDKAEEEADVAAADTAPEARDTIGARDATGAADAAEARDTTDAADTATDAHDATDAADTTGAADATGAHDATGAANTTATVPTGTVQPAEDTDSDIEPRESELAPQDIREDSLPGDDSGEENAIFERWSKTQILFVKDPSSAVAEAEALIGEIVEARRKAFDDHRASVTDRWQGQGAEPDTEDLRLVLQDYRKILSVLFPRHQV